MGCIFRRPRTIEDHPQDPAPDPAQGSSATAAPKDATSLRASSTDDSGEPFSHSTDRGGEPGEGSSGGAGPSQSNQGRQDGLANAECSVCFEKLGRETKAAHIQPCGHAKTCLACALQIYSKGGLCPICRVTMTAKPTAISCKDLKAREGRFW